MVTMCWFVRPVTVECHRPSLPLIHAQRLAGHLPKSKPPQSSEKTVIRQDTAVSCEVQSVTKPVSSVEKVIPVPTKESSMLTRLDGAGPTRDDGRELQQKKDAMRLALFYVL